jgi:ferredoxin
MLTCLFFKEECIIKSPGDIEIKAIIMKGRILMEVYVDPELCISCGTCVDLCSDVFEWDEEGKAQSAMAEVPDNMEDCAHEAVESCPVEAIKEKN